MNLTIHPQIFTDFANPRIALTVVKGANNHADISAFEPELKALASKLEEEYRDQVQQPNGQR